MMRHVPMTRMLSHLLLARVVLSTLSGSAAASRLHADTIEIAPGVLMPVVANGFKPSLASNATTIALEAWFKDGGRAVDSAFEYANQPFVGDAVNNAVAGGLPRSDIFVITKIKCTGSADTALALVKEDLKQLRLDYVDLVLIHGPGFVDPQSGGSRHCDGYKPCCRTAADIQATYRGLEQAAKLNLTRAIGVSNFQSLHLNAVLANATILPAINQMQMYVGCSAPWCATNNATIATGKAHGMTFQAYSPLGHGAAINNSAVASIAEAHNVSGAQVALAWVLQQGHALVTQSNTDKYNREDLAASGIKLSANEMALLTSQ